MTVSASEYHPYANIFPMLSRARLEELTEDIACHGLMQPIVVYEDLILDGRNRYMACVTARLDPRFVRFEDITEPGTDALQWVMSLNLKRRHLTTSQRAMAAQRFDELWMSRAAERKKWAAERTNQIRWNADEDDKVSLTANLRQATKSERAPTSAQRVAELADVSARSIESARVVRRQGVAPLASTVEDGKVPVSTAAKIARLPEPAQERIVEAVQAAPDDKAARRAAREGLREHTATVTPLIPPIAERPDMGEVYIARTLAEAILEILQSGGVRHPLREEARDMLATTLKYQPVAQGAK